MIVFLKKIIYFKISDVWIFCWMIVILIVFVFCRKNGIFYFVIYVIFDERYLNVNNLFVVGKG